MFVSNIATVTLKANNNNNNNMLRKERKKQNKDGDNYIMKTSVQCC
jgi:hypothetical protein